MREMGVGGVVWGVEGLVFFWVYFKRMYCIFLIMELILVIFFLEYLIFKYSFFGMVFSCLMFVLIVCIKVYVIIKEVKIKRKEGF